MHETSDVGVRWSSGTSFAIIPEWVLYADITATAVRLFGVLARFADCSSGESFPSRRILADRMRCSTDTVDRALGELREIGAVTIENRFRDDGGKTSNLYVLHESGEPQESGRRDAADEGHPPLSTSAASRTKAILSNESQEELPSVGFPSTDLAEPTPANRPATVARKAVANGEYRLAAVVLDEWNRQASTSYSGVDWISMIIRRIREHPELPAEAHQAVIAATLNGKRWWEGPTSPNLIYGNGAQFERCVHAAAMPPDPNRPLTPDDVRAMGREHENTIDGVAVEVS